MVATRKRLGAGSVLTHPVGVAVDVEHDAAMQEPVQHVGGRVRIVEDPALGVGDVSDAGFLKDLTDLEVAATTERRRASLERSARAPAPGGSRTSTSTPRSRASTAP